MKAEDVPRAVDLAAKMERGEPLGSIDRHWLASVIYFHASEAIQQPNPKHRPATNVERDFWATMDYLVTGDRLDDVAERWKIQDGKQLSTIMSRKGTRKECEKFRADYPALATNDWIKTRRQQILLHKSKRSEV